MTKLIVAEMRQLLDQVTNEEISFSRMVEIINEKFEVKKQSFEDYQKSFLCTQCGKNHPKSIEYCSYCGHTRQEDYGKRF